MDTRTQAERDYDDLKSGAIYAKPNQDDILIDILTDLYGDEDTPLSDVERLAIDILLALPADEDADEDAAESVPVPPVPAGYPTDLAMIYKSYGDTFISIDRRDGELLICDKRATAGNDNAVILSPARALALYRFFWSDAIIELMEYHRKNAA